MLAPASSRSLKKSKGEWAGGVEKQGYRPDECSGRLFEVGPGEQAHLRNFGPGKKEAGVMKDSLGTAAGRSSVDYIPPGSHM